MILTEDYLARPLSDRINQDPPQYNCQTCKCYDALTGSYISFVEEDTFLSDIDKYIDNAYDKRENDASGYVIKPTR